MRLWKLALVLGVAALLSAPALAQPGRGFGRGFGGNIGFLLQNQGVRDELKIDKEQGDKIREALTKVREDMRDDFDKLRNPDTSQEDRQAIQKKMTEANEKALKGVLDEKQMKRLHQIQHQQQGLAIFDDADVQKKLNLTAEQKEKIKDLEKDLQKEMEAIFPPGTKPDFSKIQENMKKVQGLREESMKSALKVLDDKQRKEVKDLTGEPFELKFEGFKPGGKPDKPPTDF